MAKQSQIKKIWQDVHLREALRGGGIFMAIKIVGTLGAYSFAWYISRKYGPEGNGILAFTLTGAVLLASIYNLGLNTYAVKIIPHFRQQKNESAVRLFYRRSLILITSITLTGSFLLLILSYVTPSEILSRDLSLMSLLSVQVSLLLFISHIFKAKKKIAGFSLLQNNILQLIALLLLMLPLWKRIEPGEPVWACIMAGTLMIILGVTTKKNGQQTKDASPPAPFTSHLKDALPMLAGGLAFIILNLTDRLMLRFLDTTPQLGIYDVVLRLSNLTLLGILSLNAIAEPKFSEFYARSELRELRRFVHRMTWTGLVISLPAIVVLSIFPEFWLGLFGQGDEFLTGRNSLYILLTGQFVSVLCGAVLVVLNMTGHQRSVQIILITATSLNIVLNAILIPFLGIEGAAWATVISTVFWNLWALLTVRKKLGFWMLG